MLKHEVRNDIPRSLAKELIVANHYLHSWQNPMFLAGLWDLDEEAWVGAITFGPGASATLRRGLCGPEHELDVVELTRLWVDDAVPRNGESFLIAGALKLVPRPIVVSFADAAQGHVGYVYQATNWLYTGIGPKRYSWFLPDGPKRHHRSVTGKSAEELRALGYVKRWNTPKHRYVFFNCKGKQRVALRRKLRYPILPYPKYVHDTGVVV